MLATGPLNADSAGVQQPDLQLLLSGSSTEWDRAFDWLWPSVLAVVQANLGEVFASDAEDIALECVEAAVDAVRGVKSAAELKLVALGIARNKAVDFVRRRLAAKRGSGRIVPLTEGELNHSETPYAPVPSALETLNARELAALLEDLLQMLEPREMEVLTDFFVRALSYAEISKKHGLRLSTVGVLLSRTRAKLRRIMHQHPRLLKELEGFLR